MGIQHHPNGVRTRPAIASDQMQVFELVEELTGEKENSQWSAVYESHLRRERGAVIVAENDDGILGIATVSYNLTIRYGGEYCELEELIAVSYTHLTLPTIYSV